MSFNYKIIKVFFSLLIIMFFLNSTLAVSFTYPINKSKIKVDESSISTMVAPEFSFQSEAQLLMEASTGKIIYENNADSQMLPASVTKIMTMLLIMEQIDLGKLSYEDKISCSANASSMGGSQIWFKEGEELTVNDALKAIAVVSANDVCVAMSEHIGGSESNFVNMMNEKAKELGMENTHFMNCHGIEEEGHYTTAKDIALMSRELITKHPDILKYTSIWMDSLRDGTFALSSTNKLIRFYDGATGLKTGFTSNAGYNLSGTATRNNTTFIAVVLKAPTSDIRLQEIKQLLDYGFASYEVQNICSKGAVVDSIKIDKNVNNTFDIVIKDNVSALVEKGSKVNTDQQVVIDDNLKAPITKDEKVGTIQIVNKDTNEIIGTSDLSVVDNVDKSMLFDYIKRLFKMLLLRDE